MSCEGPEHLSSLAGLNPIGYTSQEELRSLVHLQVSLEGLDEEEDTLVDGQGGWWSMLAHGICRVDASPSTCLGSILSPYEVGFVRLSWTLHLAFQERSYAEGVGRYLSAVFLECALHGLAYTLPTV